MYNLSPVSDKIKHTGAHILAAAVAKMKPSVKIGIGPVTKDGFYYDIDLTKPLSEKDFPRIEKEIERIIKLNLPMQQIILPREEAMNMLLQRGQIYKAEIIRTIPDEEVSFYKTGDLFTDLCRGPHAHSTGEVGAIKLTGIEEVHWNEDPSRPKMQRIYGIVFNNRDELSEYYRAKKEEEERNYKLLIGNLGLGRTFNDNVVLNNRGTAILHSIKQLIYKHLLPQNYKEIYISFAKNPDEVSEFIDYAFNYKTRSYKEFPVIFKSEVSVEDILLREKSERHEEIFIKKYYYNSDELNNTSEIDKAIDVLKALRIEFKANIYSKEAEGSFITVISNILQKEGISHNKVISRLEDRVEIVFKAIDIFNREWKLSEIIIKKENTGNSNILLMEHRLNPFAILAYILENTKGDLPASISPLKVLIIPIKKQYMDYARKVQEFLTLNNTPSEIDFRSISLKRKIFSAEKNKSVVQLVVGEKEENTNGVSVRHKNIDQGLISLEDLIDVINNLTKI